MLDDDDLYSEAAAIWAEMAEAMSNLSMDHTPPAAEATAVERVLNLPELLEWILLHVPDQSDQIGGFKALFPFQRVNSQFLQTIRSSRQLLHVMYLKNIHNPPKDSPSSIDRLSWFYSRFLDVQADIRTPDGGFRKDYRIRLPRLNLNGSTLWTPLTEHLRKRNDPQASWRQIGLAPSGSVIPARIRLRVWIFTKSTETNNAQYLRYSVCWNVEEEDTLGILYNRYLDVLTRTMEEHQAACELYRLRQEHRRMERRIIRAGLGMY